MTNPAPGLSRRLALALALAAACALLAWTSLGGWSLPALGGRQADYYNLLVEGFRKGHLWMDVEVPPAVANSSDPIGAIEKSGVSVPHDVSLFRGHYYTYYGVVPTVVLFWPFRALAGFGLPLVLGSLLFAIGGFLTGAWLLLRLTEDFFPRAPAWIRIAGVWSFGIAAGQLVLSRRVSIWEPSITAGHFFLACMLASSYRAMRSAAPGLWLAAAGAACALAAGSRPSLAVAAAGLLPVVWAAGGRRPAALGRAALWAGVPLACLGGALLWYNWARFGSPFEFGLGHQLSSWNEVKRAHFRAAYIPFNAWLYLLSVPQWGRYFPFLHPIAFPRQPPGFYGYEYVYGVLWVCPVVIWAALAALGGFRAAHPLRDLMASAAIVGAATAAVIFSFDAAAARYETDFLPWWVLLAYLGFLLADERLRARGGRLVAAWAAAAFGCAAAFSCFAAFCASAEIHEVLPLENPAAYHRLETLFDWPVAAAERLAGYRGGPIAMDVVFARRPIGSVEPMVVTGVEYQRDFAYFFYQSDTVVRLCYIHPGQPPAMSADITVVPGRKYRIVVSFGALYPPAAHPSFRRLQPTEVASLKDWATIQVDGRTVVSEPRGAYDASPGSIQVGEDKADGYCGKKFAGTISAVRRLGWRPPIDKAAPSTGDVELEAVVPMGPTTVNMPLVAAGRRGSGDALAVRIDDGGTCRFLYEAWGLGLWTSGPQSLGALRTLDLRVRVGSALGIGADSPVAIFRRTIAVWRDGKPAWWSHSVGDLGSAPPLYIAQNGVHSTAMEADFGGRINWARTADPAIRWEKGPFSALCLDLGGRGMGREPLLSTGSRGKCDVIAVDWLEGGRARLVYAHAGSDFLTSAAFPWPGGEHQLRLRLPALSCLDAAPGGVRGGALEAVLDSTSVWSASAPCYIVPSATAAVGRNPTQMDSIGSELSAVVLGISQEPLARAP